jgi:tetratricopeptide (TPR) repeat protein
VDAIGYYQRALAIDQKALGPNHPRTAVDLNNIGAALKQEGQYGEAIGYVERALAIDQKALGSHHSDTVVVLRALALARAAASGR